MTAQRQALPRFDVGQGVVEPVIARTEAMGGRVYYLRWAGVTALDLGLDGTGRAVHARITRTAFFEACGEAAQRIEADDKRGPEPPLIPALRKMFREEQAGGVFDVPGVSIDTDFGNRGIYLPSVDEPIQTMMPRWFVDFDTGIYIPHGITVEIVIMGGARDSTALAFPTFHSRVLRPWESPPPLRATYQNAPVDQEVTLVDLITGTTIAEADLHGVVSVSTPDNQSPPLRVQVFYNAAGTDSRTISAAPGVPISLSGAWKVRLIDGGHWEFAVEL